MPALEFPRLSVLQDLGARSLDGRKVGTASQTFGRELLAGFFDSCMRWGLDRTLAELAEAFPELDISDRASFADDPRLLAAIATQLDAIDLDGGGPRNARPRQLGDCVAAALGLVIVEPGRATIHLSDVVRSEVLAALQSVVDVELAVPRIREIIVEKGRARCDENLRPTFDKLAAQLDERGMRIIKLPKLPLDAVQAVQRTLFETRQAVLARIAREAIDRAHPFIARANAEAAARIDAPITLALTPRDVAVIRVCDDRLPKVPAPVVASLLESLTELSLLGWRAPEKAVRPYSVRDTYAVGDLLEHPKFGRGAVVSTLAQRIDVEFTDGAKATLVHMRK